MSGKWGAGMKNRKGIKIAVWSTVLLLTVVLMVITLYPILDKALYVAPVEEGRITPAGTPDGKAEPEDILLTAVYEQEESGKITAIYIEVFHVSGGRAYYMEVPVHTKVTLSTDLYKKLQAYSPELPQYLKLTNMGDGFSKEYCLTGCNRILSEVLGVEITHYVAANAEILNSWSEGLELLCTKQEAPREFLLSYQKWLEFSESDMSMEERWMYYESYGKILPQMAEVAPGAEGLAEYIVSTAQAKLKLEEWMRK